MKHTGDSAVVDHFVGVHRVGVITLDDRKDVREAFYGVLELGVRVGGSGSSGGAGSDRGTEEASQDSRDAEDGDEYENSTLRRWLRVHATSLCPKNKLYHTCFRRLSRSVRFYNRLRGSAKRTTLRWVKALGERGKSSGDG